MAISNTGLIIGAQVAALFLLTLLSIAAAKPLDGVPENLKLDPKYEVGNDNGRHYENFTLTTKNGNDIVYTRMTIDKNRVSSRGEVGLFSRNRNTESETASSTNVLSAGFEADAGLFSGKGYNAGVMARATAVDHTFHAGNVALNVGLKGDTGAKVDETGLEVMWFGIGGKVGPKGFQACMWVCFGMKWGA